ncbi:hypothetical protein M422DRAFT_34413 [Sphaerobolus stellatus SS14]|uniref:Uncharacterized protein n=1 Tax=Sphaerobolus stellatus (strain SS14) TaxID=990650 RepID=A0A0C9VFI5_SPHS4|nr:hypothetical protein M422DRAFT_34413 [Sphaerobolus stellatus SS14]
MRFFNPPSNSFATKNKQNDVGAEDEDPALKAFAATLLVCMISNLESSTNWSHFTRCGLGSCKMVSVSWVSADPCGYIARPDIG